MAADGAERRRFAALMDRLIKSEPKVQDYNWTSWPWLLSLECLPLIGRWKNQWVEQGAPLSY